MTAADDYATLLVKAAQLDALRVQGIALVKDMVALENSVRTKLTPNERTPGPHDRGIVAGFWGGSKMLNWQGGIPDDYSCIPAIRGAYDRLF